MTKVKTDPLLEENQEENKTEKTEKKGEGGLEVEAIKKFPDDLIARTKYILDNSEHTNFILPLAEGENNGAYDTANINGYKLTIKKGVMVNIPVAVAQLFAEKYRIAMTVGEDKRADRAGMADALN